MSIWKTIKKVANCWSSCNVSTLSAALAYYTLFSLTPILLISIHLLVLFLNEDLVRTQVLNHMRDLFGADTATQIQLMLDKANIPRVGVLAQSIAGMILIIGSSALFSEIQSGLNHIWGVRANPKGHWILLIKNRLLSFTMVLVVALLLFLSFLLSISLTALMTYIRLYLQVGILDVIFLHSLSFCIAVLLFAMVFKILPDVTIQWKNVWVGAIITTILFTAGKTILGLYLSHFQIASMYGAAGSLIILLIWVYYSAQIFFIGAILTHVISLQKRAKIKPKRQALMIDQNTQSDQNLPSFRRKT